MIFRVDLLYLAANVQQNGNSFWSDVQAYIIIIFFTQTLASDANEMSQVYTSYVMSQ